MTPRFTTLHSRARLAGLLIGLCAYQSTAAQDEFTQGLRRRLEGNATRGLLGALYDIKDASPMKDEVILHRVIELADHEDDQVREAACRKLAIAGPLARRALPVIKGRTRDSVAAVRIRAAYALWKVAGEGKAAAAVLSGALTSDTEEESRVAAQLLQRIGDGAASALPAVVRCASHSREDVRINAIETLRVLGASRAEQVEPVLTSALADSSPSVRISAAKALHDIDRPSAGAVEVLIEIARQEPAPTEQKRNQPFGAGAAGAAIYALGWIGPDAAAAVPTLGQSLKSPMLSIRMAASETLAKIGPSSAGVLRALGQSLRESEVHSIPFVHRPYSVGLNAADALVAIGPPAVPTLIEALADQDYLVRSRAAEALGRMDATENSVAALILRMNEKHPLVRIEAAKSLGRHYRLAGAAAPALTRALFNDRAFTSFRAGMGIGITESVRTEALKALVRINPAAADVVPSLSESLQRADDVPYEVIAMLRRVVSAASDARQPLRKLLKKPSARLGAASALAVVDPRYEGLEAILLEGLMLPRDDENGEDKEQEERAHPIAVMGLGDLAVNGVQLRPSTRARLRELLASSPSLFLDAALLKIESSKDAAERLLESLHDAHSVFEAIGIMEARGTLRQLAAQPHVQAALVEELQFTLPRPDDRGEFSRKRHQTYARVEAASALIGARLQLDKAVACLAEAIEDPRTSEDTRGQVADLLAKGVAQRGTAVPLLDAALNDHRAYTVGGDFYGNGGQRRVAGVRAADALVALNAHKALTARLDDPDPLVRQRVVRALAKCGAQALDDQLLKRAVDDDHRVRRAAMRTFGLVAKGDAAASERVRPALVQARDRDRHRSVRDEAERALQQLQR